MSIIRKNKLNDSQTLALNSFLNEIREPDEEEILCWIRLWKHYERINIHLVQHAEKGRECIFHALQDVQSKTNLTILTPEQAQKIYRESMAFGAKILTPICKEYPKQLKEINDFPLILHTFGNVALLQNKMFAIVGSRSASADALHIAQKFAVDVSTSGMTIVSGFANGVDTAACIGAMPFGTIQVLGSGFECLYPKNNSDLFKKVVENNGLFLSEFPTKAPSMPDNFPTRNRIITGLSSGVMIGQVNRKGGVSGTLVTLRIALSQGKEVFAYPGNILDERSKISNDLIKNGTAHFTTCVDDIINVLGKNNSIKKMQNTQEDLFENLIKDIKKIEESTNAIVFDDKEFESIYNILSTTPISTSEVITISGLNTARVQEILSELELEGFVGVNNVGKYFMSGTHS